MNEEEGGGKGRERKNNNEAKIWVSTWIIIDRSLCDSLSVPALWNTHEFPSLVGLDSIIDG